MKRIVGAGTLAGILMLVVGIVVNMLVNWGLPTMGAEYENSALFRPWADPLMSLIFLYPFLLGILLAWVYKKTSSLGVSWPQFAFTSWLALTVPGMLVTYASFQISLLMVITWTISGFLELLAGSWGLNRILNR